VNPEFWHERWQKSEIGFHQQDYNAWMQEFFRRFGVAPGARILVPLCGKSLDMSWLAEQGFRVTGVELSERAVKDFFAEQELAHEVISEAGVDTYRSESIDIICADFFSLGRAEIPNVDAVYDRASLIALPPEMRRAYADHLAGLIDPAIRILLITLEYPQEQMRGPPFSVMQREVKELFDQHCRIERILSDDCLAREPRFKKKGLTRLDEIVYLLEKKHGPAGLEQCRGGL
jgi:thiopurine S-methyltransferase